MTTATAAAAAATTSGTGRKRRSDKYQNNTSRLRKWTCSCTVHQVSADSENTRPGPYIIRCAGDALVARCDLCGMMFRQQDEAATRTRIYRGCAHCTNPEDHEAHGGDPDDMIEDSDEE